MFGSPHRAVAPCAALLAALAAAPSVANGAASLCCPADLNGDAIVSGDDLGTLLGAWGECANCPEDFNADGVVDGEDLGTLLGFWGACPTSPCLTTTVIGVVQFSNGAPVVEAVVVTDQGGSGVSGADGGFAFEVELATKAPSLQVTAVATIRGVTYTGTKRVAPIELGGATDAGVIIVTNGACTVDPAWLPTFGQRPGLSYFARTLAVFDDGRGGGPALVAGGHFTSAGGVAANYIAKWDGSAWSPLGTGMNERVYSLTVFDDGSGGGPTLYAGGFFTTAGGIAAKRIAKWNGSEWSPLGAGLNGSVWSLTVHDDGSGGGPALYAGGLFTSAGGAPANRIASWNGITWSPLGSGMDNTVLALTTFDDGTGAGPALYAAGHFTTAGGETADRVAKWNGIAWSPLGSGMNSGVYDLVVFDDGSGRGPALYAGGYFTTAGGESIDRIAKWDGSAWSAVGSGVNDGVEALAVFDDGGGPALYAGGVFTSAGGAAASRMAKWNGSEWSALAEGFTDTVRALVSFDDVRGGGPVLCAAGSFTTSGSMDAAYAAKWNGADWSPIGNGLNDQVLAVTVFDDGSGGGPQLYAGGRFTTAGDEVANHIVKWNGLGWSTLGSGTNGFVLALAVHDDGSGSGAALYAGGDFTIAGGAPTDHMAKWDGAAWSALGAGMNGSVWSLITFDDGLGGGSSLYAGGIFTAAGGASANRIAKWNGVSWSPLGSGMNDAVTALAVFDDGSGGGPALHAGGYFTIAGGREANLVAKWNGAAWSPLGGGMDDSVHALIAFDDGTGAGPALYAGGFFTTAGEVAANRVAKWNGREWSPLGSGMNDSVRAFAIFDDGSGDGPTLHAGGEFTAAGGVAAHGIATWNGSAWSPLGGGVSGSVHALGVLGDGAGTGAALIVGGSFSESPSGDSYLARWGCSPSRK